ncbi:peptidase M76 family-domain-containing protein [Hyaloraphidium curvatum]|nr:peptidase M76 family-domain-containing protein [Hyaloraphidium curvatum]
MDTLRAPLPAEKEFSARLLARRLRRLLPGALDAAPAPSPPHRPAVYYSAAEPSRTSPNPPPSAAEASAAEMDMGVAADDPDTAAQRNKCQKWVNILSNDSPLINFMTTSLKKAGCPLDKTRFVCVPCDGKRTGGYSPDMGIVVVCQNALLSKSDLESTIAHELIHAYDACTTVISPNNCLHAACTEIRASSLSGECGMLREFGRGNYTFTKGHQKCVRRRAVLSLRMKEGCAVEADRWVDEAWEACFADTAPFQEIYPP